MSKRTYENFYSTRFNKTCTMEELDQYYSEYKNVNPYLNMYCAECRQANLKEEHLGGDKICLRKIKSSKHNIGCSFYYEAATNSQVIKYVNSLSDTEMQRKLENALKKAMSLIDMTGNYQRQTTLSNYSVNPFIITAKTGEVKVKKAIQYTRINAYVNKSDENQIKSFYGQVKLKKCEVKFQDTKTGKEIRCQKLDIFTQRKGEEWKYKTHIYRYKEWGDIDYDKVYVIACIACIKFYKNSHNNYRIKLIKPTAIIIEQV